MSDAISNISGLRSNARVFQIQGKDLLASMLDQAADRIEDLERQLAAKQAEIDRLMLEFCPDEMTQEQLENWGRNQKPSRKQP